MLVRRLTSHFLCTWEPAVLNVTSSSVHTGTFEGRASRGSAGSWQFSGGETFLTLGSGGSKSGGSVLRARRSRTGEAVERSRPARHRLLRWAPSHS